jgi:hypothetical protein
MAAGGHIFREITVGLMMQDKMNKVLFGGMVVCGLATFATAAQPPISVPVVNHPCEDGPKMVGGKPEVVETPLANGFVSLFNGKDFTGWWENCATHTNDTQVGGVWIADSNQHYIYSREEIGNGNGDILVTNQTYDHYELIFDIWPIFGNDGGIFNRVTKTGKCWQTTIDYITGSGVGGSYNEGLWSGGINDDPFKFGASPENPTISTWTSFTSTQTPAGFGCSANGCIGADFTKIWNTDGWNQMRIKFYGGIAAGDSVKMETWIRKLTTPESPWVPVYKSAQNHVVPKGPIALQIHGGKRWKEGTYNIYSNIKVRPLDAKGNVLVTAINATSRAAAESVPALRVTNGDLIGDLDRSYDMTIRDLRGAILERFQAGSGALHHSLNAATRGIFFIELKSDRGVARVRMNRI